MTENTKHPVEIRLETARTWAGRIEHLIREKRKSEPYYTEKSFCDAHGFTPSFFNRVKNVKVAPSEQTVESVEAALRAEGV